MNRLTLSLFIVAILPYSPTRSLHNRLDDHGRAAQDHFSAAPLFSAGTRYTKFFHSLYPRCKLPVRISNCQMLAYFNKTHGILVIQPAKSGQFHCNFAKLGTKLTSNHTIFCKVPSEHPLVLQRNEFLVKSEPRQSWSGNISVFSLDNSRGSD